MISLIQYNEKDHKSFSSISPMEAFNLIKPDFVNWIDIETTKKEVVEEAANFFDIHPLIVEDILNLDHLPRYEQFQNHIFFTVKMLSYNAATETIEVEHLSIVIGNNTIITFQEGLEGDVFEILRERISIGKGLTRKYKADYLFYQILNSIVSHYFSTMEHLRDKMERIENNLVQNPHTPKAVESIMEIKKEINILRKYTLPTRDAVNKFRIEAVSFINKTSVNYFTDISNDLDHIISHFNTARDILKDLMDLNNANLNNETNRIMKALTILSGIFIPLTFITGIYGMNFDFIPYIHDSSAFYLLCFIMGAFAFASFLFMKKMKWF
ncbi:MAG: magnesium/cobalt transporter CorA [Chitinophagaceae bacterium]|nr:magnesium/cobalt transporter CorA [Chitinophagaceae bacterium]